MNTYDRFQLSLSTEFKLRAQPHIRSLWADLEELREATDQPVCSATLRQALRRIHALERAACAVGAHEVQALSQVLESALAALPCARGATRSKLFKTADQTMNRLTEALFLIKLESPALAGAE